MGSLNAIEVIDRLTALGCDVRLEGNRLKVRGPDCPEIVSLLPELRARREEAIQIIREQQGKPPSLEEVRALLPSGVRLISYCPKQAPFAVAPVSVVTNAGRFFRVYLKDLAWRLEHPDGYAAPPLADILSKLADAGLSLLADGNLPR